MKTFCYECLPGYSNFNGECKITSSSDPAGCGMINNGKCSYCRYEDGFRMTATEYALRNSKSEQSSSMHLPILI
jgi:hypothetical protein